MSALIAIKQFNTDNGTIEEMVDLLASGRQIVAEYRDLEETGVEMPSWLEAKLKSIRRELEARNADYLAERLAKMKLKRDQYKSPAQLKAENEKEIRRLEALVK